MKLYTWHGQSCKLIVKPVFRKGIKRNALIELNTGVRIVVPWRAIRRAKPVAAYFNTKGAQGGDCPECGNVTFVGGGVPVCEYCGWTNYP